MKKVVFKQDNQNQPALFPVSFEALIPANHPVRVVNRVIDKIDLSDIISTYKGGGASSYHPRMEFKILTSQLLDDFTEKVNESPIDKLDRIEKVELPVDYFQFYKSVSFVYNLFFIGQMECPHNHFRLV